MKAAVRRRRLADTLLRLGFIEEIRPGVFRDIATGKTVTSHIALLSLIPFDDWEHPYAKQWLCLFYPAVPFVSRTVLQRFIRWLLTSRTDRRIHLGNRQLVRLKRLLGVMDQEK